MATTKLLQRIGLKSIDVAPNGEAGLAMIFRLAPRKCYDLILMDFDMPVMVCFSLSYIKKLANRIIT